MTAKVHGHVDQAVSNPRACIVSVLLVDDQQFMDRITAKIERLTGREIRLRMDPEDKSRIAVEFTSAVPHVTLGSDALQYPGFARMAIEYVVAALREDRELGPLEFHVLLARN